MSRFELPNYLNTYLNTRNDKPSQAWVDFSQYYAGLNSYFINYMQGTVRPCIELATGIRSMTNPHISMGVGYALKKAAVQLIKGDSPIFNGDDNATTFLTDVWSRKTRFNHLLESAIDNTVVAGTSILKTDVDPQKRVSLSTYRADRCYFTTDCFGNVCEAITLATLLASQKATDGDGAYWLVEHRRYLKGKPTVTYKVHKNGGVATSNVLPMVYGKGLPKNALPYNVLHTVNSMGIILNEPIVLPFRTGLGVRVLMNTASNSNVPGLQMGDPLLYGCQDILWSIDTVFCGSMIDVLNGEGKILAPARFMNEVKNLLEANGRKVNEQRVQSWGDNDDGIVYLQTERDKDFPPQTVQFNIRGDQYLTVFEWYLRQATATAGFTPGSIFPFLQDNSPKTAREVTAEDNKTRATIKAWHGLNIPTFNEAIEEVLYISGFKGTATMQLSDYIGNVLERDANLRNNYAAGAIPRDVFVKRINNLTDAETKEYMAKLQAEDKEKREAEQSKPFIGLDL